MTMAFSLFIHHHISFLLYVLFPYVDHVVNRCKVGFRIGDRSPSLELITVIREEDEGDESNRRGG